MDYGALFSFVKKDKEPESKYQFHCQYDHATSYDWQNWLYGRLFSPIHIERGKDGLLSSVDYAGTQKTEVLKFLEYHYRKFIQTGGNPENFTYELKSIVDRAKQHDIYEVFQQHVDRLSPEIFKWIEKLEANPETTGNKGFQVDNLLKGMFKDLTEFELDTLKKNLYDGQRIYLNLRFIGTYTEFINKLKALRKLGIERKTIAEIFSQYCKISKDSSGISIKEYQFNQIYDKI